MSRTKTENLPDLKVLLAPPHPLMQAVEQAVLRGSDWTRTSAPVAEQIAARIAGVITLDLVHAGQRLLEKDISDILNVSRAPVREALRILEKDRLIEFQPRRGATVTAPDAAELNDIFVVRATLFELLFKQVMSTRPDQLEQLLARFLARLRDAQQGSSETYAVESFLLNLQIIDLCDNRIVVDLLKSISLRTLRYVRLGRVTRPGTIDQSLRSWAALLRAVADRDTATVLKVAALRIQEMRDVAIQALDASASSTHGLSAPGVAGSGAKASVKSSARAKES